MWIFLSAMVVTYLVVTLFGFVVHRSLHQPWSGKLNKSHMTHHLKLYPPSDYLSDVYRDPGRDNTVKIFAFFAVPLVVLPILLAVFGVLSASLAIVIVVEMLFIGWLHDYIHDAFHIRNHLLTRLPIIKSVFAKWSALHYSHHVDMQKNFGIFSFHWDRVFRTFWR